MKRYYFLGFLMGNVVGIIIPMASIHLDTKQIGSDIIGAVSSTYFLAMIIGARVFLELIKRFSVDKVVSTTLSLSSFFIMCFVITNQLPIWFLSMFMIGIGISFNFITLQNVLSQKSDKKIRNTGIYALCFTMGFACSALVGTSLYGISDWIPFAYASLLMLVDAGLIYYFRVTITLDKKNTTNKNFRKLITASFLILLFGGFLFGYIENTLSSLFPLYLSDYMDLKLVGITISAFSVAGNITVIPFCKQAERWGAYKVCCALSLFAFTGFIGILLTPYKLLFTIVVGCFVCAIYPITLAGLSNDVDDSKQILTMTSIYTMVYSIGAALGPIVVGKLMSVFDKRAILFVSGFIVFAFFISNLTYLISGKKLHTIR